MTLESHNNALTVRVREVYPDVQYVLMPDVFEWRTWAVYPLPSSFEEADAVRAVFENYIESVWMRSIEVTTGA